MTGWKNRGPWVSRVGSLTLGALASVWVGACAPDGSEGDASFQLRDSAGVEIVESSHPLWPNGVGWRVGAEAMVRIGVLDGDPAYQFTGITGAVRTGDGGVVMADGGSQEVRVFGANGGHLRTVGRPGEGPGEFTGLAGLGKDGADRVWAYDFSLRRITWLDGGGEVLNQTSLGLEPAALNPVGSLPGGIFLLRQLWGAEQTSAASETGFRRDPIAFVRFDDAGALLDTLGLFPGREGFLLDENGRGVMSTPPFARTTTGTIRSGRVVVGSQEFFELKEFSPNGVLLRVVRILGKIRAVGPDQLEEHIRGRLETAPPERHASIRRSLEEMPIPETMPPYGGIMGDEVGHLWVGEWTMYPESPSFWTVFDDAGAWLGEVEMPPRFFPYDIGPDWILGVERDDLDVEYLAVYALEKNSPPG